MLGLHPITVLVMCVYQMCCSSSVAFFSIPSFFFRPLAQKWELQKMQCSAIRVLWNTVNARAMIINGACRKQV